MNALLKLPILGVVSVLGAPLWMILRTWYGIYFFIWMMGAYGLLILLHQWLHNSLSPESPLSLYLLVEYSSFFQELWPIFIGYQLTTFCSQHIGIALFKFPKPHPWSMGGMLFGNRTPAGFMLVFLFGILAFFSLRYTFQLNMTAGQAVFHGMTVYTIGLVPMALLLVIERIHGGQFPLWQAKAARNRSVICSTNVQTTESLQDIFSRRDKVLKDMAENPL